MKRPKYRSSGRDKKKEVVAIVRSRVTFGLLRKKVKR